MKFSFLTTSPPSFDTVWHWAKKLITDLNSADFGSSSSALPTGMLATWGGAAAPTGWLLCDGGSYTIAQQPDLFNAIGYTYGGSGNLFNVPDCRNKLLIGAGSLVALGQTAGASTVQLSTNNLPAHSHGVTDAGHTHDFMETAHTHAVTDPGHSHTKGAANTVAAAAAGAVAVVNAQAATAAATTGLTVNGAVTGGTIDVATTGIQIGNTGGGQAVNILNPVVAVTMIIKA
ncbi:MAG: tail fiber protein [Desulfurellales bacterium]|nr:MAG: tail fiber protein [Desulfurellales bacterium]